MVRIYLCFSQFCYDWNDACSRENSKRNGSLVGPHESLVHIFQLLSAWTSPEVYVIAQTTACINWGIVLKELGWIIYNRFGLYITLDVWRSLAQSQQGEESHPSDSSPCCDYAYDPSHINYTHNNQLSSKHITMEFQPMALLYYAYMHRHDKCIFKMLLIEFFTPIMLHKTSTCEWHPSDWLCH